MKVHIHFFARARDLAGVGSTSLDLPDGATVSRMRHELAQFYPSLASFLPRCAVAVAGEIAHDETLLAENAEVALLPPVSGG